MADSEFTLALSKFIYDRLTAESPSIAPIHDHVPQGEAYAYIEIGDAVASPSDTKTSNGQRIDINIELWSRHRGRQEVRRMAKDVSALLHNVKDAAMSYGTIVHMFRDGYADRKHDAETYRGTLSIVAIVGET